VIAPTNTADDWRAKLIELAKQFPGAGETLRGHPALALRTSGAIAATLFEVLSCVRARTARDFAFRSIPTPIAWRSIERNVRLIRSKLFR
jgi:hypothetical protein